MTTVTIEQLRSAVNEIDGLAREGFSEIAATARLALAAMENPRTCNDLDTFAAAFEAIAGRAGDIEDCIGRAAEIVGCDSVDEHQNRRWNVDVEVSFFHANERHHSLAVAPRSPAPGPRKRIHHFMIEVGSVADVGRARDRCLSFGLPVVMDIGQHPNDQMISFYAYTPSGFLFEIGWGGVKVDDASWRIGSYDRVSAWGHRPFGARPEQGSPTPASVVEVA